MHTDVEMEVFEALKSSCENSVGSQVVDVVQNMLDELDNNNFAFQQDINDFVEDYANEIDNVVNQAAKQVEFDVKAEKRFIGDFEILNSFDFNGVEFCLGENPKASFGDDEKFVVINVTRNDLFEQYTNCLCSDDYNEICRIYSARINEGIKSLQMQLDKIPYDKKLFTVESCTPLKGEKLTDRVVVVDANVLPRERAASQYQLFLATGGFGCEPDGCGKVYCTNLYTGKNTYYYRHELLGIMKPDCMPEWATKSFVGLLEKRNEKTNLDFFINAANEVKTIQNESETIGKDNSGRKER